MADLDPNELALDLERIGLKALVPSVLPTSRHPLSLDRVMRSVARKRDKCREAGDTKGAQECQAVLNRWWGSAG